MIWSQVGATGTFSFQSYRWICTWVPIFDRLIDWNELDWDWKCFFQILKQIKQIYGFAMHSFEKETNKNGPSCCRTGVFILIPFWCAILQYFSDGQHDSNKTCRRWWDLIPELSWSWHLVDRLDLMSGSRSSSDWSWGSSRCSSSNHSISKVIPLQLVLHTHLKRIVVRGRGPTFEFSK